MKVEVVEWLRRLRGLAVSASVALDLILTFLGAQVIVVGRYQRPLSRAHANNNRQCA